MEIVVLSGKGGTGKTTIATGLSELAGDVIRIDGDVDAPNFYLYYEGKDLESHDFVGGKVAVINHKECISCGKCSEVCKFGAIKNNKIDELSCEGCGACIHTCVQNAIKLVPDKTAKTFLTSLDKGVISRAKMEIGSDGSGKLVTFLRQRAKNYNNNLLTIIDGSPGIGCPVISSITGSDAVLVVTEPTMSGINDMNRVIELCNHFDLLTMVCINKYDLNYGMSKKIENIIMEKGLKLVGKIPYDETVMTSINELKPITQYNNSQACVAIKEMWTKIKKILN